MTKNTPENQPIQNSMVDSKKPRRVKYQAKKNMIGYKPPNIPKPERQPSEVIIRKPNDK